MHGNATDKVASTVSRNVLVRLTGSGRGQLLSGTSESLGQRSHQTFSKSDRGSEAANPEPGRSVDFLGIPSLRFSTRPPESAGNAASITSSVFAQTRMSRPDSSLCQRRSFKMLTGCAGREEKIHVVEADTSRPETI